MKQYAVAFSAGLLVATSLLLWSGFRFNGTPSVPRGIYRQAPGPFVGFCPSAVAQAVSLARGYRVPSLDCPDRHSLLLKRAVARPGDRVEVSPRGVAVNGRLLPNSAALAYDSQGRTMPVYPNGTYTVAAGEVWVLGEDPHSFDSRYFGPVELAHTKPYRAVWLWP